MNSPLVIIIPSIIFFAILAFFCGWSIKEFFADIKPALFYAVLLYAGHIILKKSFIVEKYFILYCARLFLIMQCAALVFRTTTSIQIKDTLAGIDRSERISLSFALMLSFIPEIFSIYTALCRALKARGKKHGIFFTRNFAAQKLLFALFSLSMHRAYLKSRALAARRGLQI